jgi:hypothetical protein
MALPYCIPDLARTDHRGRRSGSTRVSALVSRTWNNSHTRQILTLQRLILKGREQEALEVMCALSELPEDDPKIQSEFNAVKDTVIEMAQGSFRDCFAMNDNRNLHRTVLAYVNQMFQQISVSQGHWGMGTTAMMHTNDFAGH